MKKSVKIIVMLMLVFAFVLSFSQVASADGTAETFTQMYIGDYETQTHSGMAHIVFGLVSDDSVPYGVIVKDLESGLETSYEGKSIGVDGKFGIALYGVPAGKNFTAKVYSGSTETGVFGVEVPFLSGKSLYTVTYLDGDQVYKTENVSHGTLLTAPTETLEKEGYEFDGWDYDFDLPVNGDITINALWTCVHEWDKGVFVSSTKSTTFTCTQCGETKTELGLANVDPDVIVTTAIPDEDSNEFLYYRYKLKINKSEANKYIFREETKSFYNAGEYNLVAPTNRSELKYVGTLLPKEIYEADYKYPVNQNPLQSFGKGEFNASTMNYKFYNFMRFIYISTGGKLELSFEYDTSFIYSTPNLSFAVRGRFIVEKVDPSLTNLDSLASFLTQNYVGSYDYAEFYEYYSQNQFQVSFLDTDDGTTGVQVGDYSWCDVNSEIPLISVEKEVTFWEYLLANNTQGQSDGMYNY